MNSPQAANVDAVESGTLGLGRLCSLSGSRTCSIPSPLHVVDACCLSLSGNHGPSLTGIFGRNRGGPRPYVLGRHNPRVTRLTAFRHDQPYVFGRQSSHPRDSGIVSPRSMQSEITLSYVLHVFFPFRKERKYPSLFWTERPEHTL